MAETIISPNVFQIESDQSLYTQAPAALGAAIVGPTVAGRPFVPTYVTTYTQYQSIFGDVFKSGSYYYEYFTSQAAKEYFQNGGQSLLVTRIISGSNNVDTYATSDIPNNIEASAGTVATASFTVVSSDTGSWIETLVRAETDLGTTTYTLINYIGASVGTNIPSGDQTIYVGVGTGSITLAQWANAVTGAINNSINDWGTYFTASSSGSTLTISTKNTGLSQNDYDVIHSHYFNNPTSLSASFAGGTDGINGTSLTIETLTWGDQMNNSGSEVSGALANGTSYNVRWEVTNVNTGSGLFNIVVRRGDDNSSQKNILETWANLSLDPQLPNYVSRVIGDLKPIYDISEGRITYEGNYANASKYIRISSVSNPNVDSIDNNGNYKSSTYSSTLPILSSGSFSGGVADTTLPKLMNENITENNIQGFTPEDYNRVFTLLSNKDEYQFNVLLAPGIGLDSSAVDNMIACSEGRGDNISIIDVGRYNTSITAAVANASGQSSNYAATYYPWVQLYSNNLGKSVWCPPSTVIGGVLAFNDQVGAEWFAPAGLNRGGMGSVLRVERRLQQSDRDILYPANINPIATFPGVGTAVWGQKTLQHKPTSLDRINVRRLLISLKGFIGNISRNLVFEQNTTVTRNAFLSKVNPYLESVVQRQGLYAYKVIMDDTNNTADVIDRDQLVGQIYIQSTKTAEFIILNYNILPTGATFPA